MSLRQSSSTASTGRGKRPSPKKVVFDPSSSPSAHKAKMVQPNKGAEPAPAKQLIYRRGEYLALRNEDDGYYLCQTVQHVYSTTARFKIQWMSEMARQPDVYIMDYLDYSEPDCIISHVKLTKVAKDTYRLPENQKDKIYKNLKDVLDPEDSENEEEEEESSDEEEEEDSDEEPQPKKPRIKSPAKRGKSATAKPWVKAPATAKKGAKGKKKVVASKVKKAPVTKKPKKEKPAKLEKPPKKRRLTPEERANPNLLLQPNAKVKVWDRDPLTNSNEKVPYISSSAHSKLVFRAVTMNDMKLLQSLIDNIKNIDKVDYIYSVANELTPLHYAVKTQNHKAIQLLMKELYNRDAKKAARCQPARNLLKTAGTGRYNRAFLGIPRVRALSMSRGSKEGNNALTKDENYSGRVEGMHKYIHYALRKGVSRKTLDMMVLSSTGKQKNTNGDTVGSLTNQEVVQAIRAGHRKLAASLLEEREQHNSSFNVLAREVMQFDNDEELRKSSLREASVKKKSWDNLNVTPIHCAAINPNSKYLSKLFSVLPEYGICDKNNRRPIHYAAACEGTGPLELLLNKGVDPDEPDSSGYTPLMIACKTGRVHNVELLLRNAKAKAERSDDDDADDDADDDESDEPTPAPSRYGVGGIDRPIQRPNRYQTYCPIHITIDAIQPEALKCLVKYGVDVNKRLSAGKNRVTPLMMAAAGGNMTLVKILIKEKAQVEEKDKLQKTPLIHAVLNGQAHVASYLLAMGANPNQADSSGNTCVHYAAAYGWFFCMKILIDAGADPLKCNDWQVSPLSIAFLKGHMGIVEYLLQQPGIDIDFKDDNGKTLVALACSSQLVPGIADEVSYLVTKKGADVTIKDVQQNTPLHHLAHNDVTCIPGCRGQSQEIDKDLQAQSMQIAKVLLQHGANGADRNEEGITPVMYAIEKGNVELVRLLIDRGGEFSMTTNEQGKNALHLMAEKCMSSDLAPLIEILHKSLQKAGSKQNADILIKMAAAVDNEGFTPLLHACQAYSNWKGGPSIEHRNNDDDGNNSDGDNDTHDPDIISNDDDGGDDADDDDAGGDDDDDDDGGDNDEDNDDNDDGNDSDYDSTSSGDEFRGRKRKWNRRDQQTSKRSKKDEEDKTVDPTWGYGRYFMTALLGLCKADPKATVQEKQFTKMDPRPDKEADRYMNKSRARFSCLHYLVMTSGEIAVKGHNGITDHSPVVTLLLKQLTTHDLNVYDLKGNTPLISCLRQASTRAQDCACKLIKHGADCNLRSKVKSDHRAAPLSIAIEFDCTLEMVDTLLSKAVVGLMDTLHHNTALHIAVSKDRKMHDVLKLVQRLLEANADVNATNRKLRTALHLAVNANRGDSDATSELEEVLVDAGANVLAKDARGRLPLHYAFTGIGNYQKTSRIDPIELCSTLTSYMAPRDINMADRRGQTALHLAGRCGAGVCSTLLVQKKGDINAKDKAGNTPLTLAVIYGHESCAIMLIQQKASINATAVILPPRVKADTNKNKNKKKTSEDDDEEEIDSEDDSVPFKPNRWVWAPYRKKPVDPKRYPVFQVCVKNNWPGVIYMMLEAMDEANLTPYNTIEAALNTSQYNLALTLIRKFKDDRKLRETNRVTGRTLLHTLAVKVKYGAKEDLVLRVARELHRRGVPLNSKDHYGCKPLHYAALMHYVPLIKFMIENIPNIDLNESDRFGRTPLAAAFWTFSPNHINVYEQFHGLSRLNDQYSFPDVMMHFGNVPKDERSQTEVEAEYVTEQKSVRCTPLIRAIQMNDFKLVKRLLQDGADYNTRDSLQRVPLVHAIRRNNIDMVKLLLNKSHTQSGSEVERVVYTADLEKTGKKGAKKSVSTNRPLFALIHGRKVIADSDDEEEDEDDDEDEVTPLNKKDTKDIDLSKYKKFPNVSGVRLTAIDQQGWSLAHHVVAPLEDATYDNVEILKLISDGGAPLAEKDLGGRTPLSYAIRVWNAPNLAKALQKLTGVSKGLWDIPSLPSSASLSDGISWVTPSPNFNADSEALIKRFEDLWMEEEPDTRPEPDEKLEMAETGEVDMDKDLDLPYDVVLTKVDVQGNSGYGQYSFYIMQVVKHKAKELWILFNRWGRIGDDGQFQRTPYGKREEAVKEFAKIFKSKTGNAWTNIKTFEPQPKKYRVVDPEDRRKRKNLRDIEVTLESDVPCHLPDTIKDIIEDFMDPEMLRQSYNHGYEEDDVPFSRLRKETITKAVAALNKLRMLTQKYGVGSFIGLREVIGMKFEVSQWKPQSTPGLGMRPIVDAMEKMTSKLGEDEVMAEYKKKFDQVVKISNEIYWLIPKSGYAYQSITVLNTPQCVQETMESLVNLAELELASRITAGAMLRRQEVHPAEYVYRAIGATLRPLNPDEVEAQYLLKYINTGMTMGSTIEAIYEVSRPGEKGRIKRCLLNNHKLLFHGTGTSNLLSILHRGLLIAPPGAILTGDIHGKGIYFADMFDKSRGYSYTYSKHYYMLVCEVALGDTQVIDGGYGEPLGAHHSRHCPGSKGPRSNFDVKLREQGCILPLGDQITRKRMDDSSRYWYMSDYSEYIVFDTAQIRLRYLIKFK